MPKTLDPLTNDLTHYTDHMLAEFGASALIAVLDGLDTADIVRATGMPENLANAIMRVRNELFRRHAKGLRFASFHDKPGADRAPEAPTPTEK